MANGNQNRFGLDLLNTNIKSVRPDGTVDLHDDTELMRIIAQGSPFASTGSPQGGLNPSGQPIKGQAAQTPQQGFNFGDFVKSPAFGQILGQLGAAISPQGSAQQRVGQTFADRFKAQLFSQLLDDLLGGGQAQQGQTSPLL